MNEPNRARGKTGLTAFDSLKVKVQSLVYKYLTDVLQFEKTSPVAYLLHLHQLLSKMGLTSKLSNSLGVEESGLRFILSMISGVVSKIRKHNCCQSPNEVCSIVISFFRLSLVPFS